MHNKQQQQQQQLGQLLHRWHNKQQKLKFNYLNKLPKFRIKKRLIHEITLKLIHVVEKITSSTLTRKDHLAQIKGITRQAAL